MSFAPANYHCPHSLAKSGADCVGPDNVVRFVEAFVDGFDLQAAGFCRVQAKATGRPGYHPANLLKLYIYGYLNRVRSSRRLEVETRRNIEVIWLLRRLTPDFKAVRPRCYRPRVNSGIPTASKSTLNAKNLEALGAERLAQLLIWISTGDAAAKRKLRLAVAGAEGPKEAAREIAKRLTSIARARTIVNRQNRKRLRGTPRFVTVVSWFPWARSRMTLSASWYSG